MKKTKFLLALLPVFLFLSSYGKGAYVLGAYYFNGWTASNSVHITPKLKDSFPERQPRWGWVTNSQRIMDQQIDAAAAAGLSFFSFCWYYRPGGATASDPLNQALQFYLSSPERTKLNFCLLIANHTGFEVGPAEWPEASREWLALLKNKQYQRADGKPLLIFYTAAGLVKKFGSAEAVRLALEQLRKQAVAAGLPGITIAAATSEDPVLAQASACGFDIITGYNYHSAGLATKNGRQAIPIDSMQQAEHRLWNHIIRKTALPLVPVVTLNWDPRPWSSLQNGYATAPYYTGFSATSVCNSVKGAIQWTDANKNRAVREKIILLYAWNENGEGAYLTPSKNGDNFLEGVKKALKKQ